MNEATLQLCSNIIGKSYINLSKDHKNKRQKYFQTLLSQKKLPKNGWSNELIEELICDLSAMDSNNYDGNIGVGEREGRVYSSLVKQRHYSLAHGIGRSGDVSAVQPKAAGSSLILKLTNSLILHSLKLAGLKEIKSCLLVPTATGMALTLCFLTMKFKRPNSKYIIWPRIDQKTCFKAIYTAGLQPIIIENILENDEVRTNMEQINKIIDEIGAENICCVCSTSSCFSPRVPDRLEDISRLCKKYDIPHVINNAYGVQCKQTCKDIMRASRVGRVDVFVQSTDKNYMVPVGGAIIVGFDKQLIDFISKMYPGRASMSPILDLFITLLSMGESGWCELLNQREELMPYMKDKLNELALKYDGSLLSTPNNPISIGITLKIFQNEEEEKNISYIGSQLFRRNMSGMRVITCRAKKTINDTEFIGYGSHINNYPKPYITIAGAIGMKKSDVDQCVQRIEKVLKKYTTK